MLRPTAEKERPKSKTYKKAWSVSEQVSNTSSRDCFPKFRTAERIGMKDCSWFARDNILKNIHLLYVVKISKSMSGHRTLRQVASCLQKYFEKLKRRREFLLSI